MALLTLSPLNSGFPASLLIDENDVYRVTPYAGNTTYPTANALVIFNAPSAFLGDQQSVIVTQTALSIGQASSSLFPLTIGGVSTYVNSKNIVDVATDGGSGSKVLIKEYGIVNTLFATETPAAVKILVMGATSTTTKYSAASFTVSANLSVSDVIGGYISSTTAGAVVLTLPTVAAFAAAGYSTGSVITFYVENLTIGSTNPITPTVQAGMTFSTVSGHANAVASLAATCVGKFEIVMQSATVATLARVW